MISPADRFAAHFPSVAADHWQDQAVRDLACPFCGQNTLSVHGDIGGAWICGSCDKCGTAEEFPETPSEKRKGPQLLDGLKWVADEEERLSRSAVNALMANPEPTPPAPSTSEPEPISWPAGCAETAPEASTLAGSVNPKARPRECVQGNRKPARLELVNAAALMAEELVPLEPFIESLLLPGVTILGGRPKSGKSILALQVAMAMATGTPLGGRFSVLKPGRVLYLALEEPKIRTQGRINDILPGGSDFLDGVNFSYGVLPLMGGGFEQLAATLSETPSELVVIDTLAAFTRLSDRRNQDIARAEYNEIDRLTKLAHKHGSAILLVAHTRKAPGADATESLMGTTGVSAACDHIWLLKKLPDKRASLEVTGRELEAETYELELRSEPLGWVCTGAGEEVGLSEERRDILELLRAEGAMPGTAVARRLHKNENAVRRLLIKMYQSGTLNQDKRRRYYVPGLPAGQDGGVEHE